MVNPEEQEQARKPAKQEAEYPTLPISFWQELVHQPQCKINGECSNCGRCEH